MNKNGANESKCQGYYPHISFLGILRKIDKFWPLKKEILRFYYHLYLDILNREEEEEHIVGSIIEIIVNDLQYINRSVYDESNKMVFMTRIGLTNINEMIDRYIHQGVAIVLEEIIKISIVYKNKELIERHFQDLYVNIEQILIRGSKTVKLVDIQKMI